MPAELDPLTFREFRVEGPSYLPNSRWAEFFFPHSYLNALTGESGKKFKKISAALDSPELTKIFSAEVPPTRLSFMQSLFRKALGKPFLEELQKDEQELSPMIPTHLTMHEIDLNSKVGLFKKNCMKCHTGRLEPRMNFMEATNDEQLWENLVNNPEVFRRLDYPNITDAKRMPPPTSTVGQMLRGEEALDRQKMLNTLSEARAHISLPCATQVLQEVTSPTESL